MASYYFNSGMKWGEYLQINSFVKDINGTIRRAGNKISYTLSSQTNDIIASNEDISRNIRSGYDQVADVLYDGFDIFDSQLRSVNEQINNVGYTISLGFEQLGASFNYGMSLLLHQIDLQTKVMDDMVAELASLHKTIQSPLLTQAKELYTIGIERLQKGLFDKALEALIKAEEKNDTDFLIQFSLGCLYLYGKNDDVDLINPVKAEKHLRNAARYAYVEMSQIEGARKYCGESYFHSSVACYVQAHEKKIELDENALKRLLSEAQRLAEKAMEICPEFAEAFYHHAKICAVLGENNLAIKSLKKSIERDGNYCLKADIDNDFDNMRSEVFELFDILRNRAKEEAAEILNKAHNYVEQFICTTDKSQKKRNEMDGMLSLAEEDYSGGTYFSCLHVIKNCKNIEQSFAFPPIHDVLDFEDQESNISALAFSQDSKFLVSADDNNTLKLWEIPSGEIISIKKTDNSISKIFMSPDSRYCLTAGDTFQLPGYDQCPVSLWELPSFKQILSLDIDLGSSVKFSKNGQLVFIQGYKTPKLYVIDIFQAKTLKVLEYPSQPWACISPDDHLLVVHHEDGEGEKSHLYDISSLKELAVLDDDWRFESNEFLFRTKDARTNRVLYEIASGRERFFSTREALSLMATSDQYKHHIWLRLNNETINIYNKSTLEKVYTIQGNKWIKHFNDQNNWVAIEGITNENHYEYSVIDLNTGKNSKSLITHDDQWYIFYWDKNNPWAVYRDTIGNDSNKIYILRLWDSTTGEITDIIEERIPKYSISPSGRYLAFAKKNIIHLKGSGAYLQSELELIEIGRNRRKEQLQRQKDEQLKQEAEKQRIIEKEHLLKAQELKARQQAQNLQKEREREGLCLDCGKKLKFVEKLGGNKLCLSCMVRNR